MPKKINSQTAQPSKCVTQAFQNAAGKLEADGAGAAARFKNTIDTNDRLAKEAKGFMDEVMTPAAKKNVKAKGKTGAATIKKGVFPPHQREDCKLVMVSNIRVTGNIRRGAITPETDPKLNDLAESIKGEGILEPLLVNHIKPFQGNYELIAGHRRLAAARLANVGVVPCIAYRGLTPDQVKDIQISENIHRSDLLPSEEAEVYRHMHDTKNYTVEEISNRVGKSPKHIARYIKLLLLPEDALAKIDSGDLSIGKAIEVCSLHANVAQSILNGRHSYMMRLPLTTKEFVREIQKTFIVSLDRAKFDRKKKYKDGKTVYPPCVDSMGRSICPRRGGQLEMFEEYNDDEKCADALCFEAKTHIAEKAARAKNAKAQNEKWEALKKERDSKWAKDEQERRERLDGNRRAAEWYIEQKVKAGFVAEDLFAAFAETDVGGNPFKHYNPEINAHIQALLIKYAGKDAEGLADGCTYDQLCKACVVLRIFRAAGDDDSEADVADWIGCGLYHNGAAADANAEDAESSEDSGEEGSEDEDA